MRRTLHFIVIDIGASIVITCGLTAFWLLCVDAPTDDVAALIQKASTNQRASEYVESIMASDYRPSHGQLIIAQATVSEILNTPGSGPETTAAHSVPWRAYAPLLVAHLFLTVSIAFCIQRLRLSRRS